MFYSAFKAEKNIKPLNSTNLNGINKILILFSGELRWTVVSSDISNSDENRNNLVFCDFLPATWYQLKMSATNDAGKTTAHYNFATTKINGGNYLILFVLN